MNLVNTCIEMMSASGATPEMVTEPVSHSPPAAMPATCVPWLQPEIELSQFSPEPIAVDDDAPPGHSDSIPVPSFVE